MILVHSIRIDPSPEQEDYFRRACGTSRFVYNWALAEWKRAYEVGEETGGWIFLKRFNAIYREQFSWVSEVHRDCKSRAFSDLQNAFRNFFRRVKAGEKPGYPKFKKKGRCVDSFYVANDQFQFNRKISKGGRHRFDDRQVRLPRIGWIKTREPLRFTGKIMGATVIRRADQWYISVRVDVGDYHKDRVGDGLVGVDLGIKTTVKLSTGEDIQGPKALKKNLKKLQRLSQRHSRKQKGSNNRRKSAMKLAKLHLRIRNIRQNFLHKLSTKLCRENQAVGIEDLNVQGMVRNCKLARSISDEGWGEFRRQIEYKAEIYGTEVIVHDRFFPSSKTCSGCGHVKKELPLSERTYECEECGLVIDRDLNAALNLRPNLGRGTPDVKPVERPGCRTRRSRNQAIA